MAPPAEALKIYLGYDGREAVASHVAAASIIRHTKSTVSFRYLKHLNLRKEGYFKRPWLVEGESGQFRDLIDDKNFSTEFSHTRFLVPELQQFKGWALFMDSDMIFQGDIKHLFSMRDDRYAIMCVKHNHEVTKDYSKMDGRVQQKYFRKNWSSFVLWNCSHVANRRITRQQVSYMPGRDLHAFNWLMDHEIGALPFTYNYISGVSPQLPIDMDKNRRNEPICIHYTEGGPWFTECKNVPYASLWDHEYRLWQEAGAPDYDNHTHKVD